MRTVIYARYSTDNQNADTIEVQVNRCAEYASQHSMNIIDVFADEAVSGTKKHRAELDRFFWSLEAKLFECVLIYDQSRLSRDIVDWFSFRRAIDKSGVKLVSVTQPFVGGNLSDPAVFASEGIHALINQMHVLQTRQKVTEKMNYLAKQGLFTGGTPCLGYDIVNKEFCINELEANIIRLIFTMYSAGCSYNNIIDKLNSKNYKTKAGKTFGLNSLNSILNNEKYIGNLTYNKVKRENGKRNSHMLSDNMIRVEGVVPPIISREVWDSVQVRIKSRKRNAANKATVDYLLSGKIFCAECGAAMCGEKWNKKYFYYNCNAAKRLRTCENKAIPKDFIEEKILEDAREMLSSENKLKEVAAKLYKSMDGIRNTIAPKKRSLQSELRQIESQIDNINAAIAQGLYSTSTVTKLKELEDKQMNIFINLSQLDKEAMESNKTLDDIISVLKNLANNSHDQKFLIALFIERVEVDKNKNIRITYNPMGINNTDTNGAADRT